MDAGASVEGCETSWSIRTSFDVPTKTAQGILCSHSKYVWTSINPSLYGASTKESWR